MVWPFFLVRVLVSYSEVKSRAAGGSIDRVEKAWGPSIYQRWRLLDFLKRLTSKLMGVRSQSDFWR